jgi:hypothetical protein
VGGLLQTQGDRCAEFVACEWCADERLHHSSFEVCPVKCERTCMGKFGLAQIEETGSSFTGLQNGAKA